MTSGLFDSAKNAARDSGRELGQRLGSRDVNVASIQEEPEYLRARSAASDSLSSSSSGSWSPYVTGWILMLMLALYVVGSISLNQWQWHGWILFPLGFLGLMLVSAGAPKPDAQSVQRALKAFDDAVMQGLADAESRKSLAAWRERSPAPSAEPQGLHFVDAEHWVRDWMFSMGADDAVVTQQSNDGGIDVASGHYIAQVKHYVGAVPISHVRDFIGVVATDLQGRSGLFFNAGAYPRTAAELLDRVGVAAFVYDVTSGSVRAHNQTAADVLKSGLNPAWS